MASQDPKTFLWSNIALLMGTASPTVDAVQRKTQVGRGTVQRIKEGSTSTGTDTLLAIADAFGVEPWELLQPQLGKQTATLGANKATPPTLAQALEVIGLALLAADPAMRSSAVDLLVTYVRDPASNDDLIPAIAKRLTAPADLQRRADIERALTKNKEGMETRDISAKTFAGDGDEPTFAKKQ